MKYIIICLIISIVACSADESSNPSTRISKIPNFISGSSDKPYAEVTLKEVEISSDGYIEKETFYTSCDENGDFSFDNFKNGNYVVIGKSDDRIAYRPNITVQDESLDVGKLEFQEYCSITGSINGDNLINSFILGLTSSKIVYLS